MADLTVTPAQFKAARKAHPRPPIVLLLARLEYDPETGALTWRMRYNPSIPYAGAPAGGLHADGYVYFKIAGVTLKAHRAAGALQTGQWPEGWIDPRICVSGVPRYLGLFATPEEAHRAYLAAKAEFHLPTILAGTFQEQAPCAQE